jgi:hypothetical protein
MLPAVKKDRRPARAVLALSAALLPFAACAKEAPETVPARTVGVPSASTGTGSNAEDGSTPGAASAEKIAPASLPMLRDHRRAFHAYGKTGDLVLASGAARFTFSTGEDVAGHRPLRGALLDAALGDADVPDPLLYFRQAWEDKTHKAHVLFAQTVSAVACPNAAPPQPAGVLVRGTVDGVTLDTTYCPRGDGALTVHTTAQNLPEGASISDELNPGTAEPTFEGVSPNWEGEYATPRVTIAEAGLSLSVSAGSMKAVRHLVHVANELFPAALFLRHQGPDVTRTLTLTAEAAPAPDPQLTADVALSFTEGAAALPVQVIWKRTGGAKTLSPLPVPSATEPVFGTERVIYLPKGRGHVKVAPGEYELIATHGPTHTLHRQKLTFAAGKNPDVAGSLVRVVSPAGWTSADFHLHAAPSPDSRVSLDERVSELACLGVDFAVATDHNRITDYGPAVARTTGTTPAFIPGVEVTTRALGHFNAFPMPLPSGAPELGVPAYWDVAAKDVFASSRAMGAKVVEVNHARMAPGIGYFDLARFDARDGSGGPAFSAEFDALEVHNGFWLEHPDRVREGANDLVGLARRGKHVAAVGNSDSHKMFFEAAGWPRTWVRTSGEGSLTDRVVAGLLRAETTISAGPFVEMTVDGKRIGATVTMARGAPRKPLRVHVRVLAPAWVAVSRVEIHVDDDAVKTIDVPGPARDGVRFEGDIDVNVDHDAVLYTWVDSDSPLDLVMARPGARPIGMTGLVWVDADGDGSVRLGARTPDGGVKP